MIQVPKKEDAAKARFKRLKVLIVDDYASMARIMETMVLEIGFGMVSTAYDGRHALTLIKKHNFDLIISDFEMPKMNGLELLTFIRKNKKTCQIPFLMVTGDVSQESVLESIKAGVSEYIIKPFSIANFQERIAKALDAPPPEQITEADYINDNMDHYDGGETPSSSVAKVGDKTRTVLLVDDEPNNLFVLTELLKESYKVQSCRSGPKALEICAKANKPDLILLDIMMPEMDGLEVCEMLKKDPLTQYIPIIFISALTQTDDVVKGLSLGAVDYVTKPITPEIVLARVANHIKLVDQRNALTSQVDALIENMKLKEEFEHTFQYGLKKPMKRVMETLPLLERKAQRCDEEVVTIKESLEAINLMASNQLNISKLEKIAEKKLKLSPICADEIIKNIVESLEYRCSARGVNIKNNTPSSHVFYGFESLVVNVFLNIITNAIDAAPDKTTIVIQSADNNDVITFWVQNDGEVPEELREDFFSKAIKNDRKKGAGMGAYSTYLSVKTLRGNIELDSSKAGATTIKLTFDKVD